MARTYIFQGVCGCLGHNIVSLVTNTYDQKSGSVIPVTELLCSKCGRSREEIRKADSNGPRPSKKSDDGSMVEVKRAKDVTGQDSSL